MTTEYRSGFRIENKKAANALKRTKTSSPPRPKLRHCIRAKKRQNQAGIKKSHGEICPSILGDKNHQKEKGIIAR